MEKVCPPPVLTKEDLKKQNKNRSFYSLVCLGLLLFEFSAHCSHNFLDIIHSWFQVLTVGVFSGGGALFLPAGFLRPYARGVQKEDGREQRQKWAERQEEEEALLHPLMADVPKALVRKKLKKKKNQINKRRNKQQLAGRWVGPSQRGSHITLLHTNSPNTLLIS